MTATATYRPPYKGRAAHLGGADAADAGHRAHRTVTWAFAPIRASSGTDPDPTERYKPCHSESYIPRYATAAGTTHHIGWTTSRPAGPIDHSGRISRIRSSRAISGGFR